MSALTTAVQAPALKRALGYRKFLRDSARVVVLDSGYHLQAACTKALEALGHAAVALKVDTQAPFSETLTAILSALVRYRPDFILAINHLGFDRDGVLADCLQTLQVPIAVWYVDSPFSVLRTASIPAPHVTSIFVWDKAYMPGLRDAGVDAVHYLPLAADERFVAAYLRGPAEASAGASGGFARDLCFVGDSMQHAEAKWRTRLSMSGLAQGQHWAGALKADRARMLPMVKTCLDSSEDAWDTLAFATFCATGSYRCHILEAMPQDKLALIGDAGWQQRLPLARSRPPVTYGVSLATAFATSRINLNATSLQMPCAVNQRVFDAPACGAFLLTDAQTDMPLHFDDAFAEATYTCAEHAKSLAAYFLRAPAQRTAITSRLRQHIVDRHTYRHRLTELMACMRQRHRPKLALGKDVS